MQLKNLQGEKFGRLTVLERVENKGSNIRYRCRCDCGAERIVYASSLRGGKTQSCGCLKRERNILIKGIMELECSSFLPINKWAHMRAGVDPNTQKPVEGTKKVCHEWYSLDAFLNWAMNNGYDYWGNRTWLSRNNPDEPWSPENCYWDYDI